MATLSDVIAAGGDPTLPAEQVVNIPAGNISATTIQAAVNELDTEKAATGHAHAGAYAPALGADDNYVTDAEKAALHASGSDNQDLSGLQPFHGFANRSGSSFITIPFNSSTRTLTLARVADYDIWINGVKTTITTNKTVVIGTGLGQHFVWFTAAGNLATSQTPWSILDTTVIPVATVHWDGTTGLDGDERHDARRNLIEHRNQHDSWGAQYVSGFTATPTFGPAAANTFSFAGGVIRDEDIYHTLTGAQTTCQIGYRVAGAATMTFDVAGTAYAKLNAGALQYDNAGTLTNVTNNSYGIQWVYATNRTSTPVVIIVGQGEYTSLVAAQAAVQPSLPGLVVAEWKLLYRVICRKTAVTPFAFTQVDVLYNQSSGPAIAAGAVSTTSAGSVTVDASGFNGNLAVTDTNLQLVAQKVDDLVLGGGGFDYVTVTSITTTATASFNAYHIASGTTADYTITLPTITAGDIGKTLIIEVAASCTKLITLSGVDIDGQATRVLWAKEVVHLRADAVGKWVKIGGKSIPMGCNIRLGANYSLASSTTLSKVTLDTLTAAAPAGMSDLANNRIKLIRKSKWGIVQLGTILLTANATMVTFSTAYNGNSANFLSYHQAPLNNASTGITCAGEYVSAAETDFIEMFVRQNSGASGTVYAGSYILVNEVITW